VSQLERTGVNSLRYRPPMATSGPAAVEPGKPDVVRRRPGGRGERIRTAVARAVLDLFAAGELGFSVADVADRAQVHRSTVYRRWPTRSDLLAEALTEHTSRLAVPDTGTWAGDVHALAAELAAFFSDPVEVAMNAALAAATDLEVTTAVLAHWTPIVDELTTPIARAIERGEVGHGTDPQLVLQLLIGPLLLQTVVMRTTPDPGYVRDLADLVVRATRTPHDDVARRRRSSARRSPRG
jgi:AcrR family transcriptional regulator